MGYSTQKQSGPSGGAAETGSRLSHEGRRDEGSFAGQRFNKWSFAESESPVLFSSDLSFLSYCISFILILYYCMVLYLFRLYLSDHLICVFFCILSYLYFFLIYLVSFLSILSIYPI